MAAEFPFVVNLDSGAISASGNATDVINVGSNEEFTFKFLKLTSATGAFDLEITDQAGIAYQQEAVRYSTTHTDQYPHEFIVPLQMPPSATFSFRFTDQSAAANRVRAQLWGKRKLV